MTAVAALAGAAGCDGGEYTVAVRFPTAELRARTAAVEIYVAPACDAAAVARGAAPSRPVFTRALTATGSDAMSARLGAAVAPGHYGVWVRARAADCSVVAAGCAEYDLVAGGRAALAVALAPLAAPPAPTGCEAPGASCVAGICATATLDGGTPPDVPAAPPDATPVLPDGGCAPGQLRCGDLCVSVASDPANCGACGRVCEALPNTSGTACAGGVCVVGGCVAGHADCDGVPANGCEADLSSPATCGACTRSCPPGSPTCSMLGGGRYDCTNGCNGTRCAGSCVDTQTDPNHCGACNHACPTAANATASCVGGVCQLTCTMGFHLCSGTRCAADNSTSACGPSCAVCPTPGNAMATCVAGMCDFECLPGYVRTGSVCTTGPSMTCGNRALDAGETCDDGNATNGDGCTATCQLETNVGADACPSATITLNGGGAQVYSGTVLGATADYTSAACASAGPDRVYVIQPTAAGTAVITVTPRGVTYDPALQVLSGCPGTSMMCTNVSGAGAPETISLMVPAALPIVLVVDSPTVFAAGDYVLSIRMM